MFGSTVTWKSSLQSVVALSTTKAEYMALDCSSEGEPLDKGFVREHIDVRMHFVREQIENGTVKVFKMDTAMNPADMLTKALPRDKLELCRSLILMYKQIRVE